MNDQARELLNKLGARNFSDPTLREVVKAGPVDVPPFTEKIPRYRYLAEIGIKDGDLIFHFFPQPEHVFPKNDRTGEKFEDLMGDAFLEVFPFPEKLAAGYTSELTSWGVRVAGYGNNPSVNQLVGKLLDVLDLKLKI